MEENTVEQRQGLELYLQCENMDKITAIASASAPASASASPAAVQKYESNMKQATKRKQSTIQY